MGLRDDAEVTRHFDSGQVKMTEFYEVPNDDRAV